MGPDHLKFGGGVTQTVLNPAVLILVLIAGVMICVWPRKKAIVAFLAAAILIPTDQVLLIAGAHFPMLRLLVLFGIIRMIRDKRSSKAPLLSGGMNKIDVALILLTIFTAMSGMLLFQASGAVIYQLGELYTVFGVYFLLRSLIRDEEDLIRTIQTLACIATVVAAIMTYELATGHNPYALLGGAHSSAYANLMQRDNKIRAIGCFSHPILAGTFGAVLVPLFVALWWKGRKYRAIAAMGIISATVMTVACNSSTPVLGYAAGVLALCLWPLRNWMRLVRWGIAFTVVSLHLVMKAPVWHLIARIDVTGGSSSWHRFMLVDQCIRHFGDWWLVGVKDTSVWGWDMWDTANQYVGTCENSGLIPFLLFLAVLVYGFKYLGKARRAAGSDKKKAVFIWGLGAALFANVVAFFGISYFDQTIVAWYGLLALISVAVAVPRRKEAALSKLPSAWELAAPSLQLAPEVVSDRVSDRVGSEEMF
jgi:cbb3-type cytochrome oxidase subunit 3